MRRRAWSSFAWIALLFGGLLVAVAIARVQREIELSAYGVRAPGTVVDFVVLQGEKLEASADFEVMPQGTLPFRVHVKGASAMRDWNRAITLNLVCPQLRPGTEECEVDAFADRWLEPSLLLAIGLPMLTWGWLKLRA